MGAPKYFPIESQLVSFIVIFDFMYSTLTTGGILEDVVNVIRRVGDNIVHAANVITLNNATSGKGLKNAILII